ncbi:hypothetical protein LTR78_010340 [Recurvomyces mirabilis]|uniref:Uncharacterized protein n=1 Tax=Recurvomyces mirabilis TaxID=574656 RepID=A0AAE0TML7_9PEZI|nr:hypothetical protein LTR78_010340 [Recurvomyces mirabilis]KAK5156219.1 hypothetical protein LTS14_005106 [Recurvomyces mirabilis]
MAVAATSMETSGSEVLAASGRGAAGNDYRQACWQVLRPYLIAQDLKPQILAAIVLMRVTAQTSRHETHAAGAEDSLPKLQVFADAWVADHSSALHGAIFLNAMQLDIRVAWLHHQPIPRLGISACLMKKVCTSIDDPRLWDARAIMLVAQVLRYCYGSAEDRTLDAWLDLNVQSEHWIDSRPGSFDPVMDGGANREYPFGRLVYRDDIYASAQLHYVLARLLLVNHAPREVNAWVSETRRELETRRLFKQCLAIAGGHPHNPSIVLSSTLPLPEFSHLLQDPNEHEVMSRLSRSVQSSFPGLYRATTPKVSSEKSGMSRYAANVTSDK